MSWSTISGFISSSGFGSSFGEKRPNLFLFPVACPIPPKTGDSLQSQYFLGLGIRFGLLFFDRLTAHSLFFSELIGTVLKDRVDASVRCVATGFRFWDVRVTNCDLLFTNCDLQFSSWDLQFTSCNLWFGSCNLWFKSSDVQFLSCYLPFTKLQFIIYK